MIEDVGWMRNTKDPSAEGYLTVVEDMVVLIIFCDDSKTASLTLTFAEQTSTLLFRVSYSSTHMHLSDMLVGLDEVLYRNFQRAVEFQEEGFVYVESPVGSYYFSENLQWAVISQAAGSDPLPFVESMEYVYFSRIQLMMLQANYQEVFSGSAFPY